MLVEFFRLSFTCQRYTQHVQGIFFSILKKLLCSEVFEIKCKFFDAAYYIFDVNTIIFCFNYNVLDLLQQYMAHLLSHGQLDGSG